MQDKLPVRSQIFLVFMYSFKQQQQNGLRSLSESMCPDAKEKCFLFFKCAFKT